MSSWALKGNATGDFAKAAMSSRPGYFLNQAEQTRQRHASGQLEDLKRILFIHRSQGNVERCLHELKRMRFTVSAEVVVTPEQFAERLMSTRFDIVVAEYPSPNCQEVQLFDVLRQTKKDVPLLFLTRRFKREIAAELIRKGAADCIELEDPGRFSVAVYRVLNTKQLRDQRDRAQKDLRLSEARYRALTGNLSYGICRCSLDGQFLEVNQAMMKILGYDSKAELLAQFHAREIILDPMRRTQLLGQSGGDAPAEPIETQWKQKDDTVLTVRLSGREVLGERGELEAYEVIAEDVTKQREIEDHLRRQATSDPLTGLANYRRLVDVLDSEIKRSKRSCRGFALLFFDVDGLKTINDRYGHLAGNQALCRLADVLSSSCRDIDTPARFAGDEFAVVLPEIHERDAKQVARRVCESVANDANGPSLSVSVGIAVYPQDGNSIEALLREADSRLYSMKQQKAFPALEKYSGTGQ